MGRLIEVKALGDLVFSEQVVISSIVIKLLGIMEATRISGDGSNLPPTS